MYGPGTTPEHVVSRDSRRTFSSVSRLRRSSPTSPFDLEPEHRGERLACLDAPDVGTRADAVDFELAK
jgi:hypothetical protein